VKSGQVEAGSTTPMEKTSLQKEAKADDNPDANPLEYVYKSYATSV